MFDKLNELETKFAELSEDISNPSVISDTNRFRNLMKEHSDLTPIMDAYREYKRLNEQVEDAKILLNEESDEDLRQLAKEEIKEGAEELEKISEQLKVLLLPKDPNDDKNVIVEIRGGAGGDEAALFANSLYRMYGHYAERRRWKTEIMSANENGLKGFKEVVFMIQGKGAYSRLKYESGVHRVQRVPETESQGRIHTSTVTVAVLPEANEVDVNLDMTDVRIDIYRSGGAGGQSVNTADSAIRVTHIPTGIVVACQDERSQLKNKEKALRILRTRIYDAEQERLQKEQASERKSQVGSGDRSEKIRTYNFPQSRVTDHRVGLTLHRLDSVLNGDLDEILDTCITHDQAKKLQGEN
ncbi:MAG: peptide chain release factor 1 [Defluviitaleaceae bacterium]|nr:peptide chain release factor 1 [Defluviitaleaceae bacterium]MCL2263440.1 peptide chain release factor 1 [Defluviitaleaceae bacterium]